MIFFFRIVAAIFSIVIGFAGLILPVLPGWLFFGVAVLLLFPEAKFTRRIAAWLEQRFPWTRRVLRALIR